MRKTGNKSVVGFFIYSAFSVLFSGAVIAATDDEIGNLQRQIDELKANSSSGTGSGPAVSLPGQYRINFYTADNDNADDNQAASRVRIRQSIDLKFDEQFKTHLQLQLNHTNSNIGAAGDKDGNDVRVRHAVMDYTMDNGTRAKAGIVPVSEYYNDSMYSWDWDYNPVALEVFVPVGGVTFHAFAGNLNEDQEDVNSDDTVHYQADVIMPLSGGGQLVISGTAMNMMNAADTDDSWHYNYGVAGKIKVKNGVKVSGFLMGSNTDGKLLGAASDDANGFAARLELSGESGSGSYGLLGTYASGKDDGTGFLMPMAFVGTYGYWGYTGILTAQGPTDTGFDGDGVNISNNGYGMSSIQAKYSFPLTSKLDGYVAAGWYGNTDAAGRDDQVGTDLLVMGTYHFTKVLTLDLGGAYAQLKDSVSGYWQGVQGGAGFNQAAGDNRDKYALFGRLQAAF